MILCDICDVGRSMTFYLFIGDHSNKSFLLWSILNIILALVFLALGSHVEKLNIKKKINFFHKILLFDKII
jgi:hypothetical protein